MDPAGKRKIDKFFHPATIKMFVGPRHSKKERAEKMKFLLLCATEPAVRDVVPGRWLMEMDAKFRNGEA